MEFFNSLNLKQIKGGTKLKQGDLGSVLSYSLTDENGQEITSFDNKTAYINLVLDDKIWFTTTTLVDISRVTFRIDKAIPIGLYYLEIKIDDYIFPSDRDSIILIEEGSTPYDLKELVPNYDVNMTIKAILSDLSQKGIDISDLNRRIGNANAELIASRNGKPNLKTRIDDLENKTTAQLAQKANKDEVTNVMTPKGNIAYASLPTSGNQVGWYYYCPDGDGTHGAGNYVWNGTSWFFGGTGDEGYNLLKEDLEDVIKSDRTEQVFWDMTSFSGWASASNDIHVYLEPIKKGDVIVSITLQNSPNYHNNGSVFLLSKASDTKYALIKKYENIATATLEMNHICTQETYIAISGEYNTNITQHSGCIKMNVLNDDFSVMVDSIVNYSLTSKVIISKKDTLSETDAFFDVGDGCRYSNIQSAISDMPENSIIHVKNGVYRYGIDARTKNVTVIGESKENCIIEFANKTYADSPVYIGIGTWKNLTFRVVEDRNASDYSRIKDLTPGQRAYAVHIDHFAGDREITFENCNFYSELNRAVGIGLKKNVTLKFIRCNFETTADISPLGCHDCDYDYFGDNQVLFLDSCNIHAKGCQYVFHTQDLGHSAQGNKMYYRFYRNIFWSDVNGKDDVIEIVGASGSGWKGTSVVTLTGDSFGNNLSDMNA